MQLMSDDSFLLVVALPMTQASMLVESCHPKPSMISVPEFYITLISDVVTDGKMLITIVFHSMVLIVGYESVLFCLFSLVLLQLFSSIVELSF